MCISLKPLRLWVVEATMIHLATTIWNLTDLGCLFPKKPLKVWPYIESEPNFSFPTLQDKPPKSFGKMLISLSGAPSGVKASWSSWSGTGKPSPIDPHRNDRRLGVGNSNIFLIFNPKLGEDEPILTSIFFKGVETQPPTRRSDGEKCFFSDFGWGVVEFFDNSWKLRLRAGLKPSKILSRIYDLEVRLHERGKRTSLEYSQGFIPLDRSLMRSCSQ